MSEADVIKKTGNSPITVKSLIKDLERLGVSPGMVLLVHSSMSSLGWVCGGPVSVIMALETVLRTYGTLIMPTHSGDLSDPAVPESWWEIIRKNMPAFDPEMTPTMGMGVIPECFRKQKDVLRSSHPQVSFSSWGAESIKIVQNHDLDYSLGDDSPLGRIYDHHAPLLINRPRKWIRFKDINYSDADFDMLGKDFGKDNEAMVGTGRIGCAKAQLFPQRLCVDYAVKWIERKRKRL